MPAPDHRRNYLILVLLGAWALSACSWTAEPDLAGTIAWVEARHPGVQHVDVDELRRDAGSGLLLFDVRSPEEYAVSHLPGALYWSDHARALEQIDAQHTQRVIVYCSVGERSSRAASALQAARPELTVANLRGGIFAWAMAGAPLVDVSGAATTRVHPYDAHWGRLLPSKLHANGDSP
ncbi:MAG: rhodanese-like domain-containing protein [Planctomycetota bacterium]